MDTGTMYSFSNQLTQLKISCLRIMWKMSVLISSTFGQTKAKILSNGPAKRQMRKWSTGFRRRQNKKERINWREATNHKIRFMYSWCFCQRMLYLRNPVPWTSRFFPHQYSHLEANLSFSLGNDRKNVSFSNTYWFQRGGQAPLGHPLGFFCRLVNWNDDRQLKTRVADL